MLKKYKAVFFDVGGTLLEVYPSVGEVYAEIARDFGFSGSPSAVDRQFRLEWKKTGGIESLGRQSGVTIERKFWRDLVFHVFEHFGGLRDFETYFDQVYEAFRSKERWRVYEDVQDSGILQTLKRRGVVLGVISNWDSRLPETLEAMGLAQHFDFILASTVVGAAKPDEKIFREALLKSGVNSREACHIGDEPIADIQGAKQAGVDAILIDRRDRFNSFRDRKIRSFLELG